MFTRACQRNPKTIAEILDTSAIDLAQSLKMNKTVRKLVNQSINQSQIFVDFYHIFYLNALLNLISGLLFWNHAFCIMYNNFLYVSGLFLCMINGILRKICFFGHCVSQNRTQTHNCKICVKCIAMSQIASKRILHL